MASTARSRRRPRRLGVRGAGQSIVSAMLSRLDRETFHVNVEVVVSHDAGPSLVRATGRTSILAEFPGSARAGNLRQRVVRRIAGESFSESPAYARSAKASAG